jgi:hypothetical protein
MRMTASEILEILGEPPGAWAAGDVALMKTSV